MTHPPYGGDEWGRPGDATAPQPSAPTEPLFEPLFGPPRRAGQPDHRSPGQPPYGPPGGYGQPLYAQSYDPSGEWGPAPTPARRSRRGLLVGLLALVAVAVALLASWTLAGSTALDPQAVQRDVAEQFEQREGVGLDLRCGSGMTVAAGRTYRCAGTTADGEPVTITITVTDEAANYTWSES